MRIQYVSTILGLKVIFRISWKISDSTQEVSYGNLLMTVGKKSQINFDKRIKDYDEDRYAGNCVTDNVFLYFVIYFCIYHISK